MSSKEKLLDEILTRGVGEFIDPEGAFRKKLEENPKQIKIKFGVDPTRPDLHLGHAVVLRKLRQFQNFGCKVIFLIGDLTAQIGDPSGKSKIRPEVNQQEVEENMKTYLEQVGKTLSTEKEVFSWIRNSDWYVSVTDITTPPNPTLNIESGGKKIPLQLVTDHILAKAYFWSESRMQKEKIKNYSLLNTLAVLRTVSFSRLIERDMFQKRIQSGEAVFMNEILYPVLQGIDSNVLADIYGSCDLEVGGTDQTFNMLVGRDIMQVNKKEPQAVLAIKLLEGLDGKNKMSKSIDNYVAITDEPAQMYGKIMSLPDSSIINYFELCTYTPLEDIKKVEGNLKSGKTNPRDVKMRLAREIVEIYYGREISERAEGQFVSVFQKREVPTDIPSIKAKKGAFLGDVLSEKGLVSSNSEFKRLVDQGGIEMMLSKKLVEDYTQTLEKDDVVRVGKSKFLKIKVK
jgi:tyrosyl-tRNA synthetase